VLWGPSRHLGSLTAANWVSFDFNVSYSSCWGYFLINTFKLKNFLTQGPTLVLRNLSSQLDKLCLSSWLVTLASGPSSNHLTSDRLSSLFVKSTCMVTPLKSHPQAVPRTPLRGSGGGGSGHGQQKGENWSLFNFFENEFSKSNEFSLREWALLKLHYSWYQSLLNEQHHVPQ